MNQQTDTTITDALKKKPQEERFAIHGACALSMNYCAKCKKVMKQINKEAKKKQKELQNNIKEKWQIK